MRSVKLVVSVCIVLAIALGAPQVSLGQYSISSIAGGGPNNLPPLSSSIGYAESVALDAAGNVYIADSYSSQIFKVSSGTLTLIAGNGTVGYTGDGGLATGAALNAPEGLVVDGAGNIFFADTGNFVIREVVKSTGLIQTVAGNGKQGYSGDGGPATSAQLNDPYGVFVDVFGNIFIADTDNFVIREVVASSGNIQTVAGNAMAGAGYTGDGGPATAAQLDEPEGVFADGSGNIFIADTYNSVIREVTNSNGEIQTVAGSYYAWNDSCNYSGDGGPPTSAQLCLPNGVLLDASGNILISDTENTVIRAVNTGSQQVTIDGVAIQPDTIATIAGDATLGAGYTGDGGPATSAQLNYPSGTVVDSSENLFIADTDNYVIREVTALNGDIQTLIGNAFLAYSGDGHSATNAELSDPGEVFVDGSGNVFIADSDNSVIRAVNTGTQAVMIASVVIQPGDIQTIAGNGSSGYSGDGNAATSAELNFPYGVFVDGSGNIFIADTENSVIREVAASTGNIQTLAGDGIACTNFSACGDGGPPTSAALDNPYAVLVDNLGNIFIADTEDSAIRVVNTGRQPVTIAGIVIQPGTIQTVAGNGTACADTSGGCGDNGPATSAELNFPTGISIDAAEDIFIADTSNNAVREVSSTSGTIQTLAGTLGQRGYSGDNGPPTSALLDTPSGVFVDAFGNIFIADTDNSAVREVVAVDDMIQTMAGTGTAGFTGDGGTAASAQLAHPLGVVGVASGNLFVADTENSRIRQLSSTVSVTVVPTSAQVAVTNTQPFAATVTGVNNTSVTWQVNGVTGGNSTLGTVSTAGLYQAPASVPSPPVVAVTAVSDANGFSAASAQVTIVAGNAPGVHVGTNPAGVSEVYTGTTQTFDATVTAESNKVVAWQVNGIAGGNATEGTISSGGVYTAPGSVPSKPLILITAVSQANQSLSDSYPIAIVTAPSASEPASQTISSGSAANYSLSLKANTGSPKQPITLSCLQSSLPPGATCAFSPKTITPGTSAVPFTLTVTVPSGTASLQKPNGLRFSPQLYFAFLPLAGILLIGGRTRPRRRRWAGIVLLCVFLFALNGCGGGTSSGGSGGGPGGGSGTNPEVGAYTIQIQGTSVAQPNPVTITTAGLTVQ
jgi:hypothetical protein